MRYVPAGCIREGMILGKSLYGANNELLLAKGQEIHSIYVESIQRMGYQGIYIEDSLSEDIEIETVIRDELKQKTISAVKDIYIYSDSGDSARLAESIDTTKQLMGEIIGQILENQSIMVNMIDIKVFHDYTFYHSVNVAILSIIMGIAMNYSYKGLYRLGMGALMHDIGKVFVPKSILDKPASLTKDETAEIRRHPEYGYDYLVRNCVLPPDAYTAVLQHHERFNGSGYPYGLPGLKIHKNCRIIAIADVYDAMTSDRPYRKALPPSEVIEYIISNSEELFDPEATRAFFKRIAPYPVGVTVRLSNGERGIVLENYENYGNRPRIRIIEESRPAREISLKDDPDYLRVTVCGIEEDFCG